MWRLARLVSSLLAALPPALCSAVLLAGRLPGSLYQDARLSCASMQQVRSAWRLPRTRRGSRACARGQVFIAVESMECLTHDACQEHSTSRARLDAHARRTTPQHATNTSPPCIHCSLALTRSLALVVQAWYSMANIKRAQRSTGSRRCVCACRSTQHADGVPCAAHGHTRLLCLPGLVYSRVPCQPYCIAPERCCWQAESELVPHLARRSLQRLVKHDSSRSPPRPHICHLLHAHVASSTWAPACLPALATGDIRCLR